MKHLVALILISFISQQAWSWGALGHQTAAQIAWDYLDKDTKAKIDQILGTENFVKASTWADAARALPEWKKTTWFHFEKVPDNYTYLKNLDRLNPNEKKLGGLIEALYVADDTLSDASSTDFDKKNALKFMIHFIADVHQPLHTGRVEDNGGNKVNIKWLGFDSNLHSVWDSQIMNLGHQDFLKGEDLATQTKNYANFLETKYKDLEINSDLFLKYDDWMHESMAPRLDAYQFKNDSEKKYTARFLDVVDKRIYLAGLRIAHSLQRVLNNEPVSKPQAELREKMIQIVGNFVDFVSLKPSRRTFVSAN